jgi:hypothetical protein
MNLGGKPSIPKWFNPRSAGGFGGAVNAMTQSLPFEEDDFFGDFDDLDARCEALPVRFGTSPLFRDPG